MTMGFLSAMWGVSISISLFLASIWLNVRLFSVLLRLFHPKLLGGFGKADGISYLYYSTTGRGNLHPALNPQGVHVFVFHPTTEEIVFDA